MRRLLGTLALHPSLQGLVAAVVMLPPMLLVGRRDGAPLLFGAAAAEVVALISSLLGFRHARFWRYQLAAFATFCMVFLGEIALCDRLVGGMGDDAMIFLGPMMTVLGSFPLAIVIRLALRFGTRPPAAAG